MPTRGDSDLLFDKIEITSLISLHQGVYLLMLVFENKFGKFQTFEENLLVFRKAGIYYNPAF